MRINDRSGIPIKMRNVMNHNNSLNQSEYTLDVQDDRSNNSVSHKRKKDLQTLNVHSKYGAANPGDDQLKLPHLGAKLPPVPSSGSGVDKANSLSRVPSISNRLLPISIGKSSKEVIDEVRNSSAEGRRERAAQKPEQKSFEKNKISNILKLYSPVVSQPEGAKNAMAAYLKHSNKASLKKIGN